MIQVRLRRTHGGGQVAWNRGSSPDLTTHFGHDSAARCSVTAAAFGNCNAESDSAKSDPIIRIWLKMGLTFVEEGQSPLAAPAQRSIRGAVSERGTIHEIKRKPVTPPAPRGGAPVSHGELVTNSVGDKVGNSLSRVRIVSSSKI